MLSLTPCFETQGSGARKALRSPLLHADVEERAFGSLSRRSPARDTGFVRGCGRVQTRLPSPADGRGDRISIRVSTARRALEARAAPFPRASRARAVEEEAAAQPLRAAVQVASPRAEARAAAATDPAASCP